MRPAAAVLSAWKRLQQRRGRLAIGFRRDQPAMLCIEVAPIAALSRREKHALHPREIVVQREPSLTHQRQRFSAARIALTFADVDERPLASQEVRLERRVRGGGQRRRRQRTRGRNQVAVVRAAGWTPAFDAVVENECDQERRKENRDQHPDQRRVSGAMLIRLVWTSSGCLRLQGSDDINDDGDERKREPLHGVGEMPLGPDAIGRSPGRVRSRRPAQNRAARRRGRADLAARAPVARVAENSARAASRRRDPRCPRQGACRVPAGDQDDRRCCATRRQLRSTAERRAWRRAQSSRDRPATSRLPRARAASALDSPPARIPRACCRAESDAADRSAREPAHADSAATNRGFSRHCDSRLLTRRKLREQCALLLGAVELPHARAAKTTRRRPLSADCRTSLGRSADLRSGGSRYTAMRAGRRAVYRSCAGPCAAHPSLPTHF